MKIFKMVSVLLVLTVLSSCVKSEEKDINEFLKIYNKNLSSESFSITYDEDRYKYSYLAEKDLLICIYTDKDGVVVQCTVTSSKPQKSFYDACKSVARAFTGQTSDECSSLIETVKSEKKIQKNGNNLVLSDFNIGTVFLINKATDELNTNSNPTLKKHIDKKDISRPTLGKDETTKK